VPWGARRRAPLLVSLVQERQEDRRGRLPHHHNRAADPATLAARVRELLRSKSRRGSCRGVPTANGAMLGSKPPGPASARSAASACSRSASSASVLFSGEHPTVETTFANCWSGRGPRRAFSGGPEADPRAAAAQHPDEPDNRRQRARGDPGDGALTSTEVRNSLAQDPAYRPTHCIEHGNIRCAGHRD
jgi:hypothetical protein